MKNNTPRPALAATRFTGTPPSREGMLSLILIFALINPAFAAPADVQTYDGLLQAIRAVQAESQKRVEQAIDREKVREAWETGKLIDAHVLGHKERADYGQQVLKRLAVDLGISHTELKYMLEFFRTYPIGPAPGQLSWSHYRELLALNEKETRKEVAEEAVRKHWSHKQVREEVQKRHARKRPAETLTAPTPGPLYTYPVVRPAEGPYAGQLALDLGFAVTFRPPALDLSAFKEGDVVALKNGKLEKAPNVPAFTYQAYVTQIIDGDTFHARIDLGFGITIHQKLRLRGLDAPVVESADGREAKVFLEKNLPDRNTPVLIQTAGLDKYNRYLVDVWAGGTYLNQQLLDEGLAVRMEE